MRLDNSSHSAVKLEDTLHVTGESVDDGIVPGGEVAMLRALREYQEMNHGVGMHIALSHSTRDPLRVNEEAISILKDTQSSRDGIETLNKLCQNLISEHKLGVNETSKEKADLMKNLIGPSTGLQRQEFIPTSLQRKLADYKPKPLSGSDYREYPNFGNNEFEESIKEEI